MCESLPRWCTDAPALSSGHDVSALRSPLLHGIHIILHFCFSLSCRFSNLGLHPFLQPSSSDDLLYIRRKLTDLLAPSLSTFTLSDGNFTSPDIPHELPSRSACQYLLFSWACLLCKWRAVQRIFILFRFNHFLLLFHALTRELVSQSLHQFGNLDSHQGIVDTVSSENVSEASTNNQWDLSLPESLSQLAHASYHIRS